MAVKKRNVEDLASELAQAVYEEAYEEGYKDGYDDGYDDGSNHKERELMGAIVEGFKKGSSMCAKVVRSKRK